MSDIKHKLLEACESVVSDLVAADYDDGVHPVVTEAIAELREVIAKAKEDE
jgi:hypothetical protein